MKTSTARTSPVKPASSKPRPLEASEHPLARDARGTADRAEIRQRSPVVSAPRQTRRPMERGGQRRSASR